MKAMRLLFTMLSPVCLIAQQFRDLDFESPSPAGLQEIQQHGANQWVLNLPDALPGWSLDIGGVPQSVVLYQTVAQTLPSASLYSNAYTPPPYNDIPGSYSLLLASGFASPSNSTTVSVNLFQTGMIPVDAKSLQFFGWATEAQFHVSLDGHPLPWVHLKPEPFGYEYGVDVSQWAGKTAELRFTVDGGVPLTFGAANLAEVHFSSVPISTPEPSSWCLATTGAVGLCAVRRLRIVRQ
jgi:hypothetical protein